ncbi:CidA/LrgA family protein [Acidaminococcus sp. NSJ-142]|jgi:holin-like protein|uniref:CidA/LrgA family protein n=1 Tax=Acidaminococcus TaxID=904 RepID=UPI000CFA29EA|nr:MULTISPECIES: CidA/LrgA family protein [Acidaminococcus]MCD2435945.1 CidA/LrgA family protein [Acidaminococcus hominis]MCH4096585.1 CidA/LrgA family protein [Acidaminococcus provencensis]RHK02550.1 CidA/LrgA family protein [Acidaminococcus sp. AM05-11]
MKIVTELALLFSLCLISAGITHLLPVAMPASVVSLLLLTLLLYRKVIKPEQIRGVATFLMGSMGIFFVPALVGTVEYLETLKAYLLPFAVVTLVTTPLVYFVTAWTIQLVLKFRDRQEVPHA